MVLRGLPFEDGDRLMRISQPVFAKESPVRISTSSILRRPHFVDSNATPRRVLVSTIDRRTNTIPGGG